LTDPTSIAIATVVIGSLNLRAAETNGALERIGVCDSRVIAYAHFWTEAQQEKP
jgi:hypothetical protein